MRMIWFLLPAWVSCGESEELRPLPAPDYELFVGVAQGVLVERCGSSTCHGTNARGWDLYAPRQRRLAPIGTFSTQSLSDAEARANYDATLGFLEGSTPLETPLLQKALGGAGHAAGSVFEHRSDPECRALRSWLETSN